MKISAIFLCLYLFVDQMWPYKRKKVLIETTKHAAGELIQSSEKKRYHTVKQKKRAAVAQNRYYERKKCDPEYVNL